MRIRFSWLVFTCIVFGKLDLTAQVQAASSVLNKAATRDPQAIAVLSSVVAALGGATNIAAIQDCVASGTFDTASDGWLRFTSFVWKNSGDQYRYELTDVKDKAVTDRSGHGNPTIEIDGKKQRRNDHAPINAAPAHLAALRLAQLLTDPKFDLIFEGTDLLNGKSVFKVKTQYNLNGVEASLTEQRWYFDQNYLPIRIEYQVGEQRNAADLTKMSADLGAYSAVNGVMVPMQIMFSMNGKTGGTAKISEIHFNSGLSTSEFD